MSMETLRVQSALARQGVALGACLVTFEFLRRLGFDSEQIFFNVDDRYVGMSLLVIDPEKNSREPLKEARTPEDATAAYLERFNRLGGRRLNIACGARESILMEIQILEAWDQYARKWNETNDLYRAQLWAQHASLERELSIIAGLLREGIEIRNASIATAIAGFPPMARA